MGTLTANSQRLPGYCDHKLPTSCRLTSIPQCCACADERAHSATYSTYIDGIGFVPRGNRWQRYCWFCKEFWENRIAATNLRPAQTRIPEVPDQTDFLNKWYEFHRGYRTVMREDGIEEQRPVLGEPFKDVSPGFLPRSLDELRAGRERNIFTEIQHIALPEDSGETGPSLEDTLDQMFEAAEAEEYPRIVTTPSIPSAQPEIRPTVNIAGQAMQAAGTRNREYQNRRIAALRRELHRMRNGVERVISGLRELGENVPDSTEATGRLAELDRSLDSMLGQHPLTSNETHSVELGQSDAFISSSSPNPRNLTLRERIDEAHIRQQEAAERRHEAMADMGEVERHMSLAQEAHTQAVSRMNRAEADYTDSRQRLNQLQREQRTADNYSRLFGTREEMERAGADYESPIGGMFTRAMDRYRTAEQTRQDERTLRQVLEDERRVEGSRSFVPEDDQNPVPSAADTEHEDQLNEYYAMLRRQDWRQQLPSGSDTSGFPTSMLNAIREMEEEERIARADFIAGMHAEQASADDRPTGQEDQQGNSSDAALVIEDAGARIARGPPQRNNVLDRLLEHTPEPERSAIIARMMENGTAQALQDMPSDPLAMWRRLQESRNPPALPPPPRPPLAEEHEYDSESSGVEGGSEDGHQGLDVDDDGRPGPKEDADMTLKMDCKVCYTQLADTACLPCGHLVLCQWCSEQHSPVMQHDKTRPRRPANCPVCRKRIKQKVRIYRA